LIDVSIVSGTYNRISFLKRMVASVRASFEGVHGLSWEIVAVDGGSTDGTLSWLKEQPDVRLIEHGNLLGAVKAFNDGALAATGTYVVLANDDIEFVGDALPRAWAFMQAHPECGIGCFYQDRNRQAMAEGPGKWHVELMPAVARQGLDFRPVQVAYGQVCIVPKALGDRVGWWGDYLHTYGGDNELSANVYEAGFGVFPLYHGPQEITPDNLASAAEGCCIHDNEPQDDLRRINNINGKKDPRSTHGHHPDSWAWGRKWTTRWRNAGRRDLGGPEIREEPRFALNVQQRDRILYLPIFERGWDVQKQQKRGLREALARIGAVVEIDHVSSPDLRAEFEDACRLLRPTIVLCQFHGEDPLDVAEARKLAPGAWWVMWNGDYWPDNLLSEKGIALARSFDLATSVNRDAVEKWQRVAINARYWQIGWEPDGRGHDPTDRCDVVFLGNGYSKERQEFVKRVRGLGYKFRLWGSGWPDGWAVGQCTYDFITACREYRGAKFSLGDSQWPDSGFVSNRVMQALAAGGSALCHQWFRGMEELGLKDGVNIITWASFEELKHKLAWYRDNEAARRQVAEAGERLALERHGFDNRVQELLGWKPGELEDWR
jgi:glycosyltransferase involved in cell wall biosynthesis